jgi:acyl-coenzyme A synthetase/AMP-(fatty) acid ligase
MAELVRSGSVPTSVRIVNLAGEALQGALVRQLYALPHVEAVYNLYGPSEDTTYSSYVQLDRTESGEPNIGRPLPNTRIHILDASQQILPPGIPGELCIAGAGLARGYLNRPELTAEKFITAQVLGRTERLYRTGDLARWLPDGNLEYLGRIDHQIKLRGFRIELGEIEAVLSSHEAVSAAAVVLHERAEAKSLAAYVVVRGGLASDLDAAELKSWAKSRLPEYMVPASVTVLGALPLTPNGKIDRRALPEPDLIVSAGRALVTPTEQLLGGIWSGVECEGGARTVDGRRALIEPGHGRKVQVVVERVDCGCIGPGPGRRLGSPF